jgi:hypothetical protein
VLTSFQILLIQFCTNFSPRSRYSSVGIVIRLRDGSSGVRIPAGARVFFLQIARPVSGVHPASYSVDTGVKHSGSGVYHSSAPSAEVMNGWSCISTSPYAFMRWTGTFLIFHMHATCRAHHVMRLLRTVKLPSFKDVPAATSPAHTFSCHTTLLSSPTFY